MTLQRVTIFTKTEVVVIVGIQFVVIPYPMSRSCPCCPSLDGATLDAEEDLAAGHALGSPVFYDELRLLVCSLQFLLSKFCLRLLACDSS